MKIIITENQLNNILKEQDEFTNQLNWLKSYIASPKYLERLKKEFPNKDQNFIESERNIRLKNLDGVKSRTEFVNAIGKSPGWISGMYNPETKKFSFEKEYRPNNWKPSEGFETIPTHEFGHAVDDAGKRIPLSTEKKIFNYTKGGDKNFPYYTGKSGTFDYYTTPTEFINRIQPIRYLLKQQNIYDASKEDFTEKEYNKMMVNPQIKNNTHFQDIMNSLKGTDQEKKIKFIDVMNTIAMNDNNLNIDSV